MWRWIHGDRHRQFTSTALFLSFSRSEKAEHSPAVPEEQPEILQIAEDMEPDKQKVIFEFVKEVEEANEANDRVSYLQCQKIEHLVTIGSENDFVVSQSKWNHFIAA